MEKPLNLSNHPSERRQRAIADITLFGVALVWGSAFVAQRVAAQHVGVMTYNGLRFLVGALTLLPVYWWFRRYTPVDYQPAQPVNLRQSLPGIVLAGLVLVAGAGFQQAGLRTTTAANAGFITGLYVVLIPLVMAFILHQRPRPVIWLAALLATVGLFLLSTGGKFVLSRGDALELIGAWMWTFHVLIIGWLVKRTPVLMLSIGQYLVCGIVSLGIGLLLERNLVETISHAWWAILYTGVMSVGLGYTLQSFGQRRAPPADAAIILSMEAVFAATFGWLILGEVLLPIQIMGCLIMLAGMLLAQIDVLRPKGTLLLVVLAITVLLVGCSPAEAVQVELSPSLGPEIMITATTTHQPSATPSPIPLNTPDFQQEIATSGPVASWMLCSPLQGIPVADLPVLVANPYHPPAAGRDDPHQGVDLAVLSKDGGYAVAGTPVQAVLHGRIAALIHDRFPYGNMLIIETDMKSLDVPSQLAVGLPGVVAPATPHPSLTCPGLDDIPAWNHDERSLYLLYAHLGSLASMQPGYEVSCGQVLGEVGSSGNALNPHLHLEVRLGPSGVNFPGMAHYDSSASKDEMTNYCLWRVSGWFQHFDPMIIFGESGS